MKYKLEFIREPYNIFDSFKAWLLGEWSWDYVYGGQQGIRVAGFSVILKWTYEVEELWELQ